MGYIDYWVALAYVSLPRNVHVTYPLVSIADHELMNLNVGHEIWFENYSIYVWKITR